MTPLIFPQVMITGHRDFPEDEKAWLVKELYSTMKRLKLHHGLEEAISGMALGADTWWAEIALKLEVPFAAYIPFEAQGSTWPKYAQERWASLRNSAVREVVLGEKYHVMYFHQRNDAMIKDSQLAIAAYRESETKGGTASAVSKIRKLGKPLIVIDPEAKTVTKENFPE